MPFAVSTGVAIAYAVALWFVILIGPSPIVALKGQWALYEAGNTWTVLVWWIAVFRLARPESWWARHLYGPKKFTRAMERYPETLKEEERNFRDWLGF